MSFPVAFQSAVFYFLACTPCAKVRHRQRAKEKAKKEREEKAKLETEQPGLYRHPSPFNTNPFWQDEIAMGPSLPKKASSKNSSQRGLSSSGRDSDTPSVSEWTHVDDSRTNLGGSSTVVPDADGLSDDWNRRRGYQREDEELWGQWSGQKIMDAFSKARDSAGRLIETKLGLEKEVTEQTRREFYFSPRNPPVNDYHPPVVSNKAPEKGAHRWMLQPPPPAKIMEGKIPVSRAVSSASKSSAKTTPGSEEALSSRKMQDRIAKEKLKKGEELSEQELIELLFASRSSNFHRSRSLSLGGVDESVEVAYEVRRKTGRSRPLAAPPGAESDDDGDDDDDEPLPPGTGKRPPGALGHVAQRPKLETIASAGSAGSLSRLSKAAGTQRPTKLDNLSGVATPEEAVVA